MVLLRPSIAVAKVPEDVLLVLGFLTTALSSCHVWEVAALGESGVSPICEEGVTPNRGGLSGMGGLRLAPIVVGLLTNSVPSSQVVGRVIASGTAATYA